MSRIEELMATYGPRGENAGSVRIDPHFGKPKQIGNAFPILVDQAESHSHGNTVPEMLLNPLSYEPRPLENAPSAINYRKQKVSPEKLAKWDIADTPQEYWHRFAAGMTNCVQTDGLELEDDATHALALIYDGEVQSVLAYALEDAGNTLCVYQIQGKPHETTKHAVLAQLEWREMLLDAAEEKAMQLECRKIEVVGIPYFKWKGLEQTLLDRLQKTYEDMPQQRGYSRDPERGVSFKQIATDQDI